MNQEVDSRGPVIVKEKLVDGCAIVTIDEDIKCCEGLKGILLPVSVRIDNFARAVNRTQFSTYSG